MNARDYAKNPYLQRQCTNLLKEKVDEEIVEKFDVKSLSSASDAICVADLGCAAGPNTFIAMNNVIKVMEQKYQIQCPDSQMPRFQVFFNDLALNDFNILFTSLPQDRQYFVAGVPGSFYEQLFPDSSIHFVHTSYAMHWLSKLPKELQAWNKGRIHYTNAPHEVVNAYSIQFAMDVENFLKARAKELVAAGMMIIIMPACQNGMPYSSLPAGVMFDVMASSLMEMVEEI
uniref:S-adenosylmethionine-dependent methyltransferase n=1 Tax=Quercus lobata TaxID=97700 RepID=A0A7N2L7A8_QUELO